MRSQLRAAAADLSSVVPVPLPADSVLTPRLMTAQEVGDLLNGVPVSTVHAWARSGYLPNLKIGRHRRFVRTDILGFIERQRPVL
jgi:excisionase family DNA binding protein